MTGHRAARRAFLVVLAAAGVLLLAVARPLAGALVVAAVLATVLAPLHRRLCRRLGGRSELAAGVMVLAAAAALVAPVASLSVFFVSEGRAGLQFVSAAVASDNVRALVARLPDLPGRFVVASLDWIGAFVRGIETQTGLADGAAVSAVASAVSMTGSLAFGAAMTLIALYFLLAQGDDLIGWLDRISPLRPGQMRELLDEFKAVSSAVVVSSLITCAVQAAAALVGYLITGVPHPLFFAAVTFLMAFVPAIGGVAVALAAAGILFVGGAPYAAAALAVWAVVVVGLVDNLVLPFLIKSGLHISGGVIFFALIGGLGAFGIIGLFIGPLGAALFLALLRIYARDFGPASGAVIDNPAPEILRAPDACA